MALKFATLKEAIKPQNWKVLQILIRISLKKTIPKNDSKTTENQRQENFEATRGGKKEKYFL